ncbi:MAG: M16 family metallopeptidase [Pyrinomonadaceae bacterium]
MKNKKRKMKNKFNLSLHLCVSAVCLLVFSLNLFAQIEKPPAPSAPRVAKIPPVQTKKLSNGLTVASVERKNVPLVTVSLLIKSGADSEAKDGLANMTAALLTRGTKTRSATQIAEQIEFLGGRIRANAGWNSTVVSVNVASDKLDQALAIMSDVVLNPAFEPKEIELFKSQTVDNLNVVLKQPSSLANFVASRYTFDEHNSIGTPESLNSITKADVENFYRKFYAPKESVLIFAGDITNEKAAALAQKYFGEWSGDSKTPNRMSDVAAMKNDDSPIQKILVIDLPNSGQTAVIYAKKLERIGRSDKDNYFPATVLNAVLGGGYSARLNEEIRIKRGLSYGAASSFNWQNSQTNFLARTQTKNVSAAQVAELVAAEIDKIGSGIAEQPELTARKLTLTGDFGRDLETTDGLADRLVELYTFDLNPNELNTYTSSVQNISAGQVKNFAAENLKGGDLIIVGDAKIFMDDLKKRFPNQKIETIEASDLDLNRSDLRKAR